MTVSEVESKNWPGTKWSHKKTALFVPVPKEKIILPKIKDLPIYKESVLSKPMSTFNNSNFWFRNEKDQEQYANLSCIVRANLFPGPRQPLTTSMYSSTYTDPFKDPLFRPYKSSCDFRRRRQGFGKLLEQEQCLKRLDAAWKEYYANKKIVDWEAIRRRNQNRAQNEAQKLLDTKDKNPKPNAKRPKTTPNNDLVLEDKVEPAEPAPDNTVFQWKATPTWAQDSQEIEEVLEKSDSRDMSFWNYYDDPLNDAVINTLDALP